MAVPKFPEREEQILKDWQEQHIFEQTLAKPSPKGRFVFFEGPPTANGTPHIGHVETRAFKDVILRFKTMQGYHVERKAGWDTQGLPVELEVEKQLGISGKKDIEKYGVAEFNAKAKESVWKYKALWEQMSERVGFWLDFKQPYITYDNSYIETLWWIFKQVWEQKLLVQDYKVVPYCPRCGTALSSHEVAQGYQKVTEPAVYVKFELVDEPGTFVLAWTTTPWTLPGNVALAVGKDIEYIKAKEENGDVFIVAESLENVISEKHEVVATLKGSDLVGKQYKPLFDFLDLRKTAPTTPSSTTQRRVVLDTPPRAGGDVCKNAYTIVSADFVQTNEGTGIVHAAVMYGEDDFNLGKKLDLPKVHTVDLQGKFNELVKPWAGLEVKDAKGETQAKIIAYLQEHGLLYKQENYTHDYPFCWRCKHPLLYYAKTSWFILMSKLRDQLIANNEKITWYPKHIQEGRFGEWLREVKDWAISRERYWGTPLPIWLCDNPDCGHQECLGSYEDLATKMPKRNRYIFLRHGEADINVVSTLNTVRDKLDVSSLTSKGEKQAASAATKLKEEKIDAIFTSQFLRAKETAAIVAKATNAPMFEEPRINEYLIGPDFEGKTIAEFHQGFGDRAKRMDQAPPGGETWLDIRARMFDFLHDLDAKHEGKTFVVVTHADPLLVVQWALSLQPTSWFDFSALPANAQPMELGFAAPLYQSDGSFDPHRPFLDGVVWPCTRCAPTTPVSSGETTPPQAGGDTTPHPFSPRRGTMKRAPEVADTWFDSGSMPFAQWHYPFENKERIDEGQSYPADYITEAIDQTRGWFYTLLAVGTLLQKAKVVKEPPYKRVIVLGHLKDAQGRKLSKSLGNYLDPMGLIDQYGADAIRWYLYTVNQPWDAKNFDPKGVDSVVKKTFLIVMNVVSFLKLYTGPVGTPAQNHVLDRWMKALLNELIADVTRKLEAYDITGAGRALEAFITDVSTWYVRRSRERFKHPQEALEAAAMLQHVLQTLSRLTAPLAPFLAEDLYHQAGGTLASVHLESWPEAPVPDRTVLEEMAAARRIVEQGHALRAKQGLKVRQPLGQAVIAGAYAKDIVDIVKDELNVKEIVVKNTLANLPSEYMLMAESPLIALDTTITDELREEGMVRDFIREVNALRKTAGLRPSDEIILYCEAKTLLAQLIERYQTKILSAVKARAATPAMDGAEHHGQIILDGTANVFGLTKK